KVTLMTVHSAKGLEFEHVFVVGMEEDLFPSAMAKNELRGLEEERRLFYVAITRAKKTCTVSYAKSRFKNGQLNSCRESQFLNDIDIAFLNIDEKTLSNISNTQNTDGFWKSMERQSKITPAQTRSKYSPPKQLTNISRIQTSNSSAQLPDEAKQLKEGNIIEHERFGRGKVISIEQDGNNKRAFVEFESAGRKQLLLKFAKFNIVE
ncbi:MAG: 3'-5' exonuclease, partial [Proteiniphilum sp.]|nr:3'-5' exonuclease [Proteiniphilum sp.]